MRMPLEEFGRSLMRVRANDHVGTHLIACIFDAALRDFFGLAERSAHADDCGLMFFGPRRERGSTRYQMQKISAGKFHFEPPFHSHHSITSSARTSSVGGTSKPSDFAVLRLRTVSYFVGIWTGRSAGFAPRSIRSTYVAA